MKNAIDGNSLSEWIEDRYFYCDNAEVNAAVGDIIEKIHCMMMEDNSKAEQKSDFFEYFLKEE